MSIESVRSYIRDSMVDGDSPADEVITVKGDLCIRVDGELIGIKVVPVKEISMVVAEDKPKKELVKKKPVKKKGSGKPGSKKPTAAKKTSQSP